MFKLNEECEQKLILLKKTKKKKDKKDKVKTKTGNPSDEKINDDKNTNAQRSGTGISMLLSQMVQQSNNRTVRLLRNEYFFC